MVVALVVDEHYYYTLCNARKKKKKKNKKKLQDVSRGEKRENPTHFWQTPPRPLIKGFMSHSDAEMGFSSCICHKVLHG